MTREEAEKIAYEKYPREYHWREFGDGQVGMFDIYLCVRERYIKELMEQ